jgi:hypothetical protein
MGMSGEERNIKCLVAETTTLSCVNPWNRRTMLPIPVADV